MKYREAEPSRNERQDRFAKRIKKHGFFCPSLGSLFLGSMYDARGRASGNS
jgi:hypothetical protein